MIDILTGTAFDAPKRLNHRYDEGALEFPSSVSSRARGLLALKACNWGVATMSKPTLSAFVQTKGLSDSFWAAPISQLGCSVAPANPEHFAFVVDMEFEDGFFTGDYGIFGFTKCNLFFHQNMSSLKNDPLVYAYAPGSVINVNGIRHIVTPGERHVIKFEFDPLVGSSVDVDGDASLSNDTSLKLPHDTSFKFGGSSTSTVVTSVTRPVKMRVYGVKILQFHNLVADLVPYNDGSDVGMMDKLSGNKFPGSNLEYGEV